MNEKNEISMGEKIRSFRKNAKLTQKELAEKLHVTDKAVSKWETGKGFPDIAILPLLADVFNVSPSSFFDHSIEVEDFASNNEQVEKRKVNTTDLQTEKQKLLWSKLFKGTMSILIISLISCLLIDWLLNKEIT